MSNPLLNIAFPIRFDEVEAAHVEPAVDELLERADEAIEALAARDDEPTFENTMLALEDITEALGTCMSIVSHLENVCTTEALREANTAAQPRVSELVSKIPLHAGLWRRLERYAQTEEAKALTGPRRRFLDKTVADFKRHGADLDEAGKKRLAEIDVELTKLTLKFSQNGLDATNAFELVIEDEKELEGLPENAKKAAAQSAKAKGKSGYRFTLQPPSILPVLRFLDDRSIREHMYRAMLSRATSGELDNRPLVKRIIELRKEKADLLGYDNFADLVLEDRMAQRGDEARRFVADLTEKTKAAFERENEELAAFAKELGCAALESWDVGYYAEKLRKKLYDFDEETLRPYFAFEKVVDGLFGVAERLYGIRFEPWNEAPRWHESVRAYRVLDADDAWLAGVYFDPFPRETKQSGAWAHGILGRARDDEDARHIAVIVGNITPPLEGEDAQLSHRDVETLFHEFGHLMHHVLSRVALRSQVGTNVAWDFVELPSQIMENWCWEREALDLFSVHKDTGERIPDELLNAMRRSRTFRAANAQMRQLGFATMDLGLHIDYEPSSHGDDVVAYARSLMQPFSATKLHDDWSMVTSFDHLFSSPVGYAAAYYSYKWAEVLDADAFTRFKREGLFNRETGSAFRNEILARGDEADPAELFRAFMGRAPDQVALLERLGLVKKAA
jgi:oligopeptidase A